MLHRPWKGIDVLIEQLARSTAPRSDGLHVSELYSLLHPQKARSKNPITEDELRLYAIGGFSLEMVLEAGFKALVQDRAVAAGYQVERPPELESSEGVKCSPDLYFYQPDGDIIIADMKCKWVSINGMPTEEEGEDGFPGTKFDKIFTQLMSYLHVLSEQMGRSFTRAYLIVYFVCGNYRDYKPRLVAWELEWSQQEISENWDALMAIRAGLRQ